MQLLKRKIYIYIIPRLFLLLLDLNKRTINQKNLWKIKVSTLHLRPRTSILLCDRAKLRSNPCLSKRKKGPRSSGTRVDQIARVVFHCRSIRSRLVDRRFATYLSNAFRRDRYSWRTGVRRDRGTDYAVDQARVRAEFRGLDATSIDRTRQRGVRRGMNLEKGGESVDLSRWRTIFDRGRVFRMIFGERMER